MIWIVNYNNLYNDNLTINSFKNTAIIVNDKYINEKIVNNDYNYEYIIENLDNSEVKLLFYKKYLDEKILDNEKFLIQKSGLDEKYNILFRIELLENIKIILKSE